MPYDIPIMCISFSTSFFQLISGCGSNNYNLVDFNDQTVKRSRLNIPFGMSTSKYISKLFLPKNLETNNYGKNNR